MVGLRRSGLMACYRTSYGWCKTGPSHRWLRSGLAVMVIAVGFARHGRDGLQQHDEDEKIFMMHLFAAKPCSGTPRLDCFIVPCRSVSPVFGHMLPE